MKVTLQVSGNYSYAQARKAWERQEREHEDYENFRGKYKLPSKYKGKEVPDSYEYKDEENVMGDVSGEGNLEIEISIKDEGERIDLSFFPRDLEEFRLIEKVKRILESSK